MYAGNSEANKKGARRMEEHPTVMGKTQHQKARHAGWQKYPHGRGEDPAGQTGGPPHQKHPHGRGEDDHVKIPFLPLRETPPRAWGRHEAVIQAQPSMRNTPTGVGKTGAPIAGRFARRKHPHGRGEDCRCSRKNTLCSETPPRAWGRLVLQGEANQKTGNTPTGVGKTGMPRWRSQRVEKHPHGRGED